ncbi:MAG: MCP four helix bundle domain-containing protein, partial [Treponema sp.]|nr:MCP four helix bundle domain-containing protein [Treponema sp.]
MNLIRNMKLRAKLFTSFIIVAAIMLTTLLIAIIDVNKMVNLSDQVVNNVVEPLGTIFEARMTLERMKIDGRDILLEEDSRIQIALINDFLDQIVMVKRLMKTFSETIQVDAAHDYYHEFVENMDTYEANMTIFREKLNRRDDDVDVFLHNELSPYS